MRSILRRIIACFATAMMVCAMSLTAYADPVNDLSVVIENQSSAVSIKGAKCLAYKLLDIDESEKVREDKLKEIKYNCSLNKAFSGFTYKQTDGTEVSKESLVSLLTSEMSAAEIESLTNQLVIYIGETPVQAVNSGNTPTVTLGNDGVERATIGNLSSGCYLIRMISGSDADVNLCAPMLVSVVTGQPAEPLNPKFPTPSISKELVESSDQPSAGDTEGSAYVGESISFRINTFVPTMSPDADGYEFRIIDTYTPGLEPDLDKLVVKIGDTTIDPVESIDMFTPETMSYVVAKGEPEEGESQFTVTFNPKAFHENYSEKAGTPITISYTAKVTEDILNQEQQESTNKVKLEFGNGQEVEGNGVTVSSYNLDVYKTTPEKYYDDNNVWSTRDAELAGAQFKLYKEEGEKKLYYCLGDNSVVSWTEDAGEATVRETGEGGKLNPKFTGLAKGVYMIEEVKAPAGYNRLSSAIKVEIPMADVEGPTFEVKVENNKGIQLPGTGGVGTIIFYCVGGALVIGALVVLIARRRMSSNQK